MSLRPKPRGFWDYSLSSLLLTGMLLFLFWIEASDGVAWADAALAFAAAVSCVLAIIFGRRNEKAPWIVRPTWRANLILAVSALLLIFGAIYLDEYMHHRRDITANRFQLHVIVGIVLLSATLLRLRKRNKPVRRQLP